MELFLTILGTAITVLSFVYAFYANRRLAKLEDYNREQAWEIYRQASNTVGYFQNIHRLNINNPGLIGEYSSGERAAIELVADCVRMIKRFEKKYSEEEIQEWLKQGKIFNESHLQTFRNFIC